MSHDEGKKAVIRQLSVPVSGAAAAHRVVAEVPRLSETQLSNSGVDSTELSLREYVRVLYKYRIVIAAIATLGAVFSLLYAFTATPRFSASSKIRISTYQPVLAATRIEDMLEEKSKESNYLETQVEELKSFSVADRVLQDPELSRYFLRETGLDDSAVPPAGNRAGYKTHAHLMRAYLDSIEITPVRRTSLVSIDATAKSASIAALIASRHASTYIEWVRTTRVEQQARALQFLRQQAEELRQKVADLEREMADYAEANAIVAVNKDENIVAQKMAQLNQLLTEVNGKRLEAENLYRQSDSVAGDTSAGFDDPSLQLMRADLARAESEYQQLSAKFMPGYPRMIELQERIAGLKRAIVDQRRQIVAGLKAKAEALVQQERGLKEELEQQKSRAFELSKKQVQYNSLNRELTSSRELLENVLRQIKETGLSVESNASNISIVDEPVVPLLPSFPRKKLMVLIGMLLGFGLGVAAAFLLELFDNSIKTPEDIGQHLRLPNLGVVPSFEVENGSPLGPVASEGGATTPAATAASAAVAKRATTASSAGATAPVVFLNSPRSLAAEAYRTIRTGILLSQAGEPPRTILVTSAQSGDGKTTSAVNLAASLASSGGRVVLIDADLRRPSVGRYLAVDGSAPGLVEILTGQRTIEEVAITGCLHGVTVIPSGEIPPNPAELVGSAQMLAALERMTREFDYVVIDSPPVLPVTDSVVLSRLVDGVLLVVRGGATPRRVAADAKERLVSVGARLIGAMLNDVDITAGEYRYYHRYYHSYYRRDDEVDRPRGVQRA